MNAIVTKFVPILFVVATMGFILFGGSKQVHIDEQNVSSIMEDYVMRDAMDAYSAMTTRIPAGTYAPSMRDEVNAGSIQDWNYADWEMTLNAVLERLRELSHKARTKGLSPEEEVLLTNLAEYIGALQASGSCPDELYEMLNYCSELILEIVSVVLDLPNPGFTDPQNPGRQFAPDFNPQWNFTIPITKLKRPYYRN